MALVIRAVYEQGRLRPLDPVDLVEGQQVTVRIERQAEREAIDAVLQGVLVEFPDADDNSDAWVEDMAEEIDLAFRGEPPLSEIIIQDRGEW